VSVEEVLQFLRQLPPRDRLRVVVEVLPDLESILPDTPQPAEFWEGVDVRELAESQGVSPADDFQALLGGWPEDESVDDFITTVRQGRQQSVLWWNDRREVTR
jgi:hypothetical protein